MTSTALVGLGWFAYTQQTRRTRLSVEPAWKPTHAPSNRTTQPHPGLETAEPAQRLDSIRAGSDQEALYMPRNPYRRLSPLERRISDEILEQQSRELAFADEAIFQARHFARRAKAHRQRAAELRDLQQQLSEIVMLAEFEETAA